MDRNNKQINDNGIKKCVKVRTSSVIGYSILLAIVIFLLLFLNSYTMLCVLVAIIVLPVMSVVNCIILSSALEYGVTFSEEEIEKNSDFALRVWSNNPIYALSLSITVWFDLGNSLYDSSSEIKTQMSAAIHGRNENIIRAKAEMNGIVTARIMKVRIMDVFGMITVNIVKESEDYEQSSRMIVYPKRLEVDETTKSGFFDGVTDATENNLKGNDYSDVSNIREYVPGDRMKDIHWRLTAKKGELMIKERSRISERQLIMLVDFFGDDKDADAAADESYNLAAFAMENSVPVRFLWWKSDESAAVEKDAYNIREVRQIFAEIYVSGRADNSLAAKEYLKVNRPDISKYVRVGAILGAPEVVNVENV